MYNGSFMVKKVFLAPLIGFTLSILCRWASRYQILGSRSCGSLRQIVILCPVSLPVHLFCVREHDRIMSIFWFLYRIFFLLYFMWSTNILFNLIFFSSFSIEGLLASSCQWWVKPNASWGMQWLLSLFHLTVLLCCNPSLSTNKLWESSKVHPHNPC